MKRCQIILEGWQLKHCRDIAKTHNISLCEVIRRNVMYTAMFMKDKAYTHDYDDLNYKARKKVDSNR